MNGKRMIAWLLALALACTGGLALAAPAQDRMGNPIDLPETVGAIVSLAPSTTQVLADLGAADRIVAIDTYSLGTKDLPEGLPAFDMMAPDVEQLIALSPDVVFVTGMMLVEGDPLQQLTDMGIAVAYIPSSNTIADIQEDILFIGEVVGDAEGAARLVQDMQAQIDLLRVETDEPIPVYFEVGAEPGLYSFGAGTFLNEMIELVGGKNIFADQEGWLSVSDESVIAADPQVIFTNDYMGEAAAEGILARTGWEEVSAVKEGRVFYIDSDASAQPNHRIVEALKQMAEAME